MLIERTYCCLHTLVALFFFGTSAQTEKQPVLEKHADKGVLLNLSISQLRHVRRLQNVCDLLVQLWLHSLNFIILRGSGGTACLLVGLVPSVMFLFGQRLVVVTEIKIWTCVLVY